MENLSWSQFIEWQAIYRMQPFGELRDDYRSALIGYTIAAYAPFIKNKGELKVSDFLVDFDKPEKDLRVKDKAKHLGQLRSLEKWMEAQAPVISDREGNLSPNPEYKVRGGVSVQKKMIDEQGHKGRGLVSLKDMVDKEEGLRQVPDNRK